VANGLRLPGFRALFAAGLAAVVLGYLALGLGSLTLAPLLLVAGYCLVIPVALFRLGHSDTGADRPPRGE